MSGTVEGAYYFLDKTQPPIFIGGHIYTPYMSIWRLATVYNTCNTFFTTPSYPGSTLDNLYALIQRVKEDILFYICLSLVCFPLLFSCSHCR